MTITNSTSRATYVTNPSVTRYTYLFKIFAQDQVALTVVNPAAKSVTPLYLTTDYTVSGVGDDSGGAITLTASGVTKAGAGNTLVIMRDMPFIQSVDYRPHDIFPAETHERALDVLTMQDQQLLEMLGRAVVIPPGLVGDDIQVWGDFVEVYDDMKAAKNTAQASSDEAQAAAAASAGARDQARAEADRAEHTVNSIKIIWASAEGVPHTEHAAVNYNPATGEMRFNIPAGEPGPPGETPALDVIDGGGACQTHLFIINGGAAIQNT